MKCPYCGLEKNPTRETIGHGMSVDRWDCGSSDGMGEVRRGKACLEIERLNSKEVTASDLTFLAHVLIMDYKNGKTVVKTYPKTEDGAVQAHADAYNLMDNSLDRIRVCVRLRSVSGEPYND